jgi:hypothetical protein
MISYLTLSQKLNLIGGQRCVSMPLRGLFLVLSRTVPHVSDMAYLNQFEYLLLIYQNVPKRSMLDLAETPNGNVLLAASTARMVSIFDLYDSPSSLLSSTGFIMHPATPLCIAQREAAGCDWRLRWHFTAVGWDESAGGRLGRGCGGYWRRRRHEGVENCRGNLRW